MHRLAFNIFGFQIYSYALCLLGAFACALWLAPKMGRMRGECDTDYIYELTSWAILIGIVGCRVGFVVQEWPRYAADPIRVFYLREGGMTILGGIIASSVVLGYYFYSRKIAFLNVLDLLAAPTLLGMAVGRFGCIMHGCCYGKICEVPWSFTYPEGVLGALAAGPRHPTQVYEMIADLILMGFVIWSFSRFKFAGQALYTAICGYGMIRFSNEFLRDDGVPMGPLTGAQWAALAFTVIGALGLLGVFGKPPIDASWQVPPDTTEPEPKKKKKNKKTKNS